MKPEEKNILLQDLCARLPYRVKVAVDFKAYLEWLPRDENLVYPYRRNLNTILDLKQKTIKDISKEPNIIYSYPCTERFQMMNGYTYREDYGVPMKFIKPYLRLMSSMTEEEYERFVNILKRSMVRHKCYDWHEQWVQTPSLEDWLNAHHFDYRGLIPMGLALEAHEGMYKI